MAEYSSSTYGDRFAEIYDELAVDDEMVAAAVERIVRLAEGGRVLELGVGTGRLAIPLAEAGLDVHGIDSSPAMLARLRAKPGADRISLRLGDFGEADLGSGFAVVLVAVSTFFLLRDQQMQVACFQRVARALRRGGRFVVEAFVPDPARFDRGQRTSTLLADSDVVRLETATHDPAAQRVDSVHVVIRDGRMETYPIKLRYARPGELDLMGRMAGLELESRWGSWSGEPFGAASASHVSVWQLP